jgi:hypothetical protein
MTDGRSDPLEKIITPAQSSYNVIENVRSVPGFTGFKRKRSGKVKTRTLKTGGCGTPAVFAPPAGYPGRKALPGAPGICGTKVAFCIAKARSNKAHKKRRRVKTRTLKTEGCGTPPELSAPRAVKGRPPACFRIFSKASRLTCALTCSTASLSAVPLICTMVALPEGWNEQSRSISTLLRFAPQHGCDALSLTRGKFILCRFR